jgi:hypothetical protein
MELLEERGVLRRQMLYPPELRARHMTSFDFKPLPEFANLSRLPESGRNRLAVARQ